MENKTFLILAKPTGKARPRFTKKGLTYTPKNTKRYEQLVKQSYLEQTDGEMIDGNIQIAITSFFKPAKSNKKLIKTVNNTELVYCDKKPDLDNIAKAICDGLNGVAYADDKQIVKLSMSKVYSQIDCVLVSVSKLSD